MMCFSAVKLLKLLFLGHFIDRELFGDFPGGFLVVGLCGQSTFSV